AAQAQGLIYDDGSHRQVLGGLGTLAVDPGSQVVRLRRIVAHPDRTDAAEGEEFAVEPGSERELPAGRYLADNGAGATRALRIERGGRCVLALPAPSALPKGVRYIPAGMARVDGRATSNPVGHFGMLEREVSCAEWLEFVNALPNRRLIADAYRDGQWILVPRESVSADLPVLWRQNGVPGKLGTFVLETRDGTAIDPRLPVSSISHDDAVAYARWRAERDQLPWRLPTRLEWTMAAQGGDGRTYPWGDRGDPGLCCSFVGAAKFSGILPPGGSFPSDRSVQGVFDLAGSLSEYVEVSAPDATLATIMGGNRADRQFERFATWARRESVRKQAYVICGVRLALTIH
ncbi:MAG: SUMF1/EgtB/PvdO family nonheme iron enzyme, partial [Planctomycetes bacterium]|nr:SUMF1/EgtB/PvdO family nonheme iron enzyme [Planctomycetota bacterium]